MSQKPKPPQNPDPSLHFLPQHLLPAEQNGWALARTGTWKCKLRNRFAIILTETWLNSSITDDAVNTVEEGVRHISCQTSTLTVNHLTASAQFTIVSVTSVYVPPSTGTKGPWSVLYWNVVGMQEAAFHCCWRFLPVKCENSCTIM